MNKSVLVIDTPNNCALCQMGNYDMSKGGVYCQLNKKENISWKDAQKEKPDWCPLGDLPEKYEIVSMNFERGYNVCIDEILKGANGNESGEN